MKSFLFKAIMVVVSFSFSSPVFSLRDCKDCKDVAKGSQKSSFKTILVIGAAVTLLGAGWWAIKSGDNNSQTEAESALPVDSQAGTSQQEHEVKDEAKQEQSRPLQPNGAPISLNTEKNKYGRTLFNGISSGTNQSITFDKHDTSGIEDRNIAGMVWMQILDTIGENIGKRFSDDTASALYKLDSVMKFIAAGLDFRKQEHLDRLSQTVYESFLNWRDSGNSLFLCSKEARLGLGGHMSKIHGTAFGDKHVLDLISNPKANSAGNGVAMGLLGATMLARSPQEAEALGVACGRATHPGKDACDVTACMSHMLYHATHSTEASLRTRFDQMMAQTQQSFSSKLGTRSTTKSILARDWESKPIRNDEPNGLMGAWICPGRGTVTDSLQMSLRIVHDAINKYGDDSAKISEYVFDLFDTSNSGSEKYFDRVYRASADYDTVGAYTGQILGCLLGTRSIPAKAKSVCKDNQRVYDALCYAVSKQ